jgi:hypothetical protein
MFNIPSLSIPLAYTMTCILTARQRLGKHIPVRANACKNRTSIARQRINEHASLTIESLFSVGPVQNGYMDVFGSIQQGRTGVVESNRDELESPAGRDMSLGAWNWIGQSLWNWQLQNNGKKGIRLWKEDFMCDLKLQWDCCKSVARIRLMNEDWES